MTEKLSARQLRRKRQEQLLRAYEKNRRRNLLATPGIHDFIIVLDHLKAGYNVPKIFRSAEAFGAREVHLVNIGPFDPAPAKGAFRQVPARFFDSFGESHSDLVQRGYRLYALSADGSHPLQEETLPGKSAFVFGHEEMGLSFCREAYADIRYLQIPQFGQMESLNVSIAASIVMYEYTRQVQA
ncbi:TrmH family RNA methyltransferase [Thiolapillus sp.]